MLRRATHLLLATTLLAVFCQAQKAIDDQRTNGLLNDCEAAAGPYLRCPKQSEFGEIIKGIDRFYQEPENLRLGFTFGMRVYALKVAGAKTTEIDAEMDAARKYADKPQAPK